MQGLDLNKYKPKYILVEILKDDYQKIVDYLNIHSYKLICNFSDYNKNNHRRWDGTHNDYLFKNDFDNLLDKITLNIS